MNNLDMHIARLYTPTFLRVRVRFIRGIDKGRVAQLGEHRPYKPGVTGSSPVPPTIGSIRQFNGFNVVCYEIRRE